MRISMRTTVGLLLGAALAFALVIPMRAAFAAVTSAVIGGTLTVTGDGANDVVDVTCSDPGNVQVNGADPDTGPASCSTITAIVVSGGDGNDLLRLETVGLADNFPAVAAISVDGGLGNDIVIGTRLDDTLTGGDGIDRMIPVLGTDAIDGGAGTDEVNVNASGDAVLTTTSVTAPGVSATLASIETAQLHHSGASGVTFDASAFAGSVTFETGGGDDVLIGGPQADTLDSAGGDDTLLGNGGNDFLIPGSGAADVVDGGAGGGRLVYRTDANATLTDTSLSGPGFGVTLANVGSANLIGGASANRLSAAGFSGRVTILGRGGADVLIDGPGNGVLDGAGGADRLTGASGDDDLLGGAGPDVLDGGPGNDLLDGGTGTDDCRGGPGRDIIRSCE